MATINVNNTSRFALEAVLITMECPVCGISYAMPEAMQQEAHRKGNGEIQWYCPNGHRLGYHGPSEAQQKAERLQKMLANEQSYSSDLNERLKAERTSHAATKGKLTKTRKRIAGGACPCCNRSFENLARHMASKHPGYPAEVDGMTCLNDRADRGQPRQEG